MAVGMVALIVIDILDGFFWELFHCILTGRTDMEVKLEVDMERLRYSLVGDGYLLEEVENMDEEKLVSILKDRICRYIEIRYRKSKEYGLLDDKL